MVSIVGDLSDVDDLVQQVSLIAWRKFSQFSPGTDFTKWVCEIAYREAKHFFRTRSRYVQPSDELLEMLYRESIEMGPQLDAQVDMLDGCLASLPARDHEILYLRYFDEQPVEQIAEAFCCSPSSVYKSLERIHGRLSECVTRKLQAEDRRQEVRV